MLPTHSIPSKRPTTTDNTVLNALDSIIRQTYCDIVGYALFLFVLYFILRIMNDYIWKLFLVLVSFSSFHQRWKKDNYIERAHKL